MLILLSTSYDIQNFQLLSGRSTFPSHSLVVTSAPTKEIEICSPLVILVSVIRIPFSEIHVKTLCLYSEGLIVLGSRKILNLAYNWFWNLLANYGSSFKSFLAKAGL